ncbi:hypothetical protein NBRC116601_15860 [Cognatishimia sp. WU-CL00825]
MKAKDPCKLAFTPWKWNGLDRIMSRKRAAATIGPIVWDDDGPTPTLNISKTDKNMVFPYNNPTRHKLCDS